MDYSLQRLKKHLQEHYQKHGLKGGIYQYDFEGYFASIPHEGMKERARMRIINDSLYSIFCAWVEDFQLLQTADPNADVKRGAGLGSENSQLISLDYASPIDHFIKEICGIKGYGRYMEDRKITVSRVNATLTFPSSIILICSMNPCPCMEQYEISSSATYDPQNPYLPALDESMATRMRNARIRRNLTMKQFAELAETSTVTISEFENGHRMQARYLLLKRMATILHVSPVWLAGFDALPDTTLVEKIHKARMYRLYTLTEAANFFHVDPKTFGAWEHGRGVIKKEYLDAWLNVLNVSIKPRW